MIHRTWFQFSLRTLFVLVALVAVGLSFILGLWNQSPVNRTGRELDLAIFGPGYFCLYDSNADTRYYTRHGHFHVDGNSQIAYGNDLTPLVLEPTITISPEHHAIRIDRDGLVRVESGQVPEVAVGNFALARFSNPDGLQLVSPGLYRETRQSGCPIIHRGGDAAVGQICQGWLEIPSDSPDSRVNWSLVQWFVVTTILIVIAFELMQQRRLLARLQMQLDRNPAQPMQDSTNDTT